ncbi:hypothetical protein ACFZ8E_11600 [Methylobacterium sp. HMF5984]|uniref:hypothetical protein n=1 Tax=Methylobacterium sp. HMF5984 TaxID=3367370 RepID=UPI003853D2A7
MVAYSFKARFAAPILAGTKAQTIPAERTGRSRHARPGEQLQLFSGMRTKHCLRLGDPSRAPRDRGSPVASALRWPVRPRHFPELGLSHRPETAGVLTVPSPSLIAAARHAPDARARIARMAHVMRHQMEGVEEC